MERFFHWSKKMANSSMKKFDSSKIFHTLESQNSKNQTDLIQFMKPSHPRMVLFLPFFHQYTYFNI